MLKMLAKEYLMFSQNQLFFHNVYIIRLQWFARQFLFLCVFVYLQLIVLDCFLTITFKNTTFKFHEFMKQLIVHIFNKNLYIRSLKITIRF